MTSDGKIRLKGLFQNGDIHGDTCTMLCFNNNLMFEGHPHCLTKSIEEISSESCSDKGSIISVDNNVEDERIKHGKLLYINTDGKLKIFFLYWMGKYEV